MVLILLMPNDSSMFINDARRINQSQFLLLDDRGTASFVLQRADGRFFQDLNLAAEFRFEISKLNKHRAIT